MWWKSLAEEESPSDATISAEAAADFIRAVIEAHRTIYCTHIVDRMQEQGKVIVQEDWKQKGGLPLPAQFLLYAGGLGRRERWRGPASTRQPMANSSAELARYLF